MPKRGKVNRITGYLYERVVKRIFSLKMPQSAVHSSDRLTISNDFSSQFGVVFLLLFKLYITLTPSSSSVVIWLREPVIPVSTDVVSKGSVDPKVQQRSLQQNRSRSCLRNPPDVRT